MAASIDFSQFTFTADEVRQFNELIVKKVTETPSITSFHTFYRGIRNDENIGLASGTFGLLGKAAQGCDPTADTNQISTQQKQWAPKRIGIYIEQCWSDLNATFGRMARNTGVDVVDLTNTEYFAFMLKILTGDGTAGGDVVKTIFRHAWFGDTAAAAVDDSPAGVLTSGTDPDYFNVIDGFFTQLSDIITATPARRYSLNAYNGQATYALQDSTLTNQLAYEAILGVIDSAKPALRSQPDQVIICTANLGRKAMRYLQSQGLPYNVDLGIKGLAVGNIDGKPIYMVDWFDDMIRTYEDNGTKYNNPHRIVYTTQSNLSIGMEGTDLFNTVSVFNDLKSEKNFIRLKDAFDAKVLQDDLVQYGV